ncbi:chemotaxis protein CheX [Demequina sp.]|uniref:chemotaxis protein CheX n=1 Tax=Demequina sp. TaxID=2050685 RepID=UPI003A83A159
MSGSHALVMDDAHLRALVDDVFVAMASHAKVGTDAGGALAAPAQPVRHAWVEITGDVSARVVISVAGAAAEAITRELLGLGHDAPVSDADVSDALGELVNVLGGNVKSVLAAGGTLSIPATGLVPPASPASALSTAVDVPWRGLPVHVRLTALPSAAPRRRETA